MCVPDTLKPGKLKGWSSEQRKEYCRAKQDLGGSCSKVLNSLTVWGKPFFIGKILVKVYRVCDLHLIVDGEVTGWYSRNLSH